MTVKRSLDAVAVQGDLLVSIDHGSGGQGWNGDRVDYCFAEAASVELEEAYWEGKDFESRKVLKYEGQILRVGVEKVVRGVRGQDAESRLLAYSAVLRESHREHFNA